MQLNICIKSGFIQKFLYFCIIIKYESFGIYYNLMIELVFTPPTLKIQEQINYTYST